ncbi:methyltransferase domain-containing protein [Lysobacter tyrosinilyticus]
MTDEKLITWFSCKDSYLEHERRVVADCTAEAFIASQETINGVCPVCKVDTVFRVSSGARFEDRPNLREGLVCKRCHLTARQRTLLLALLESSLPPLAGGAILERHSRLYRRLKKLDRKLVGSEYLGPTGSPGQLHWWLRPGKLPIPSLVRHESITALSYSDGALGYIAHTDVLEHIHDVGLALTECRRVLASRCPMIFTAPFFTSLSETVVRGFHDANGNLVELLPSEYHGDGVRQGGIYTYYNFGWSFFDLLRNTFPTAEIGLGYSVLHGLVQADSKPGPWNMGPVVFRCRS